MRAVPAPQADLTEIEFQRQVVSLLRQIGYSVYHTHDSRRSQPGFPDLVAVGDRVVYLELKRETGKTTDPQRTWITRLAKAGAEVYVARPRHLQDLAIVLAARVREGLPFHEARGRLLLELDTHLTKEAA